MRNRNIYYYCCVIQKKGGETLDACNHLLWGEAVTYTHRAIVEATQKEAGLCIPAQPAPNEHRHTTSKADAPKTGVLASPSVAGGSQHVGSFLHVLLDACLALHLSIFCRMSSQCAPCQSRSTHGTKNTRTRRWHIDECSPPNSKNADHRFGWGWERFAVRTIRQG